MKLHPQLAALEPALIIFDKDGTLIDFHTMWGKWLRQLARRLEAETYLPIATPLFQAMDFEAESGYIAPGGELAVTPMAGLERLTRQVLREAGASETAITAAMEAAWCYPDPADAQPLADLPALFGALRKHGLKIAIATSDDYAPTVSLVEQWGLTSLVEVIVGADNGLPIKPAPDVIQHICRTLNISPPKTVMVGDNVADIQMGQAAGVGLTVGVLSGVSSAVELEAAAMVVLASIQALVTEV
jgi:HAD superfamily hydrolase (TIGR01549 family)